VKRRGLQDRLCRLALRIASPAMRPWAAAMVREVDEIDDPRVALEWAFACLVACASERLGPLLRPVAVAARLALAACCLWIAGRMTGQVAPQLAHGAPLTWVRGLWLAAAALFAVAAPLVALRRGAAAWIAIAATAITAGDLALATSVVPFDVLTPEQLAMIARERMSAYGQIAGMSGAAFAAFWLTRRSRLAFETS
jgi:hypothetical protein